MSEGLPASSDDPARYVYESDVLQVVDCDLGEAGCEGTGHVDDMVASDGGYICRSCDWTASEMWRQEQLDRMNDWRRAVFG